MSLAIATDRTPRPPLPTTRAEMLARGWESVDVVFVSGDAYVDHPSFANGLLARLLEAAGFRVAVLAQPDWSNCEAWRQFGRPRLFFGVSAGNMDSMINHYTANRKVRNDDAYSPHGEIGRRPDRATLAYCQRSREAFPGVPVVAGGVEASLRRIAHYDYWSDTVRRSILLDSKADLVVFGMGERTILDVARGLDAGKTVKDLRDLRGVAYRLGASEPPPVGTGTLDLPDYDAVVGDKLAFCEMTRATLRPRGGGRESPRPALGAGRNGRGLWPAVHASAASFLWNGADSCLRGRRDERADHAGLLRRLHVLFDHGPRRADHPEPLTGIDHHRDQAPGVAARLQRHGLRHRRADGQHVSDAVHAA
jgi:hypothetical protein